MAKFVCYASVLFDVESRMFSDKHLVICSLGVHHCFEDELTLSRLLLRMLKNNRTRQTFF